MQNIAADPWPITQQSQQPVMHPLDTAPHAAQRCRVLNSLKVVFMDKVFTAKEFYASVMQKVDRANLEMEEPRILCSTDARRIIDRWLPEVLVFKYRVLCFGRDWR